MSDSTNNKSFLEQLSQKDHPITQFLALFEEEYWTFYSQYLCIKSQYPNKNFELYSSEAEDAAKQAIRDVKNMIYCLSITIISMYKLHISENDLDQDLLYNYVTGLLLRNDTYFAIYNLCAKSESLSLYQMQWKMNKLENLRPKHLEISNILSLDPAMREYLIGVAHDEEILAAIKQPYHKTIERLLLWMKLECPITKLDVIYRIFTGIMGEELRLFWEGYKNFRKKDMFIDSPTLRLLMVYVLTQTKQSKLKIDLDLIQEFMPKVLEFTNRAYYIALLQSAFEFIDNLTEEKTTELLTKCHSPQSFEKFCKDNHHDEGKNFNFSSLIEHNDECNHEWYVHQWKNIVDRLLEVDKEKILKMKIQQK